MESLVETASLLFAFSSNLFFSLHQSHVLFFLFQTLDVLSALYLLWDWLISVVVGLICKRRKVSTASSETSSYYIQSAAISLAVLHIITTLPDVLFHLQEDTNSTWAQNHVLQREHLDCTYYYKCQLEEIHPLCVCYAPWRLLSSSSICQLNCFPFSIFILSLSWKVNLE